MVRNLAIPGDAKFPTAAALAAEFARTGQERWERLGQPIPVRQIDDAVELAPESGIAQLFWTRIADFSGPAEFDRCLDPLIDTADLDADLRRDWLWVRVVDFWLWELSVGLTDDPGGCATILDWLGVR